MNTLDFLIGVAFLLLLAGGGWVWRRFDRHHAERARRAALKHWLEREYPDA